MQGPGGDLESVTGLAAGRANVMAFTTGRGSTTGQAVCPVIKVASNSEMFGRMSDDMDVNAGMIVDGAATIEVMGRQLFDLTLDVASGRVRTASERLGHRQFEIWPEAGISL
jgi:arabinonate dehydratase